MNKIKVVLADDHELLMDGIASLLQDAPGIQVVGKAPGAKQAELLVALHKPGVLITDISMGEPNGLELTRTVTHKYPLVKIMVLSMHDDVQHIGAMMDAGASGYLLKNVKQQELIFAIRELVEGRQYIQQSLAGKYARAIQQGGQQKPLLSAREVEIIRLIAAEFTTAEISEKLFISTHTVETHRKNIIRKTKVKSVVGLLNYARQQGIL